MRSVLFATLMAAATAAQAEPPAWDPAVHGGGSPHGMFPTEAMARDYRLATEPAINGQVSRYGLFPSQEQEYVHHAPRDLALEPAVNGEVSSSGRFRTQAREEAYRSGEIARGAPTGAAASYLRRRVASGN